MKILPILRTLQGKGFDKKTLIGMSCNALCLQRLHNGINSQPVDPITIENTFFGDENETIQSFFITHNELAQNDLSVLTSTDIFLKMRANQIAFDEHHNALPCQGDILKADINDHKQFLLDGANQLMANGLIPSKRLNDFFSLTSVIMWPKYDDEQDESSFSPAHNP